MSPLRPIRYLLALLPAMLAAQGAPGNDIYLAPLTRAAGVLRVGAPANVTSRPGYDNQPAFSTEGRLLYFTSQREGQTDIYRFDVAAGTTAAVTTTRESEYSPTVMPDGAHLSVIRVELDSAQRLWSFTLTGQPVGPVLDSLKPIGYHAWLNPDTVFVFVLGAPATLQRVALRTQRATVLASDIGRGLFRIPGRHAISYVQRDSAGNTVRAVDPATGESRALVRLPAGNEFYTWTPDGEILSARGNRLLLWKEGAADWTEVAVFAEPGLQRISRIAVSPNGDRIALVGEEAPRP